MRKITRIVIVIASIAALNVAAATLDFKPLAMPTKPSDRLIIRGFDGDVRLISGRGPEVVVKVREDSQVLEEWNFTLQRVEGGIELAVQSLHTKENWRTFLLSGGIAKFHLTVTAPDLPVDLAWRKGKVQADNWNGNLRLSLQEGQVEINGGKGDTRAIGQSIDIRVRRRAGNAVLETDDGKINVEDLSGNVDLEDFSGEIIAQKVEGELTLHTFKAPLAVTTGKGRLEFETIRGPVKVTGWTGDLKGVSDEASVTARVLQAGEVRVISGSGPVSLEVPNSGASLSVTSTEGGISGPSHLKSDQLAGARVMRGRLKGSAEGSIIVRTQSGPVRIR
jgi:hypothetical protein